MVRQRRKKPRKKKALDSITTMTVEAKGKQPRNWNAVNAQFRTSAGPMHDRRKEDPKADEHDGVAEWLDELARKDESNGNDKTRDGGSDLRDEDV